MAMRLLHSRTLSSLQSSSISLFSLFSTLPDSTATLLPPLIHSVDADSIHQILLHQFNPFHAMESSLQLHGISLSPHLLDQTLLRLKYNSKIALAFFTYSKTIPSSPASATSYNILVDILGRVLQFDVVWQLIVEMDQRNLELTSATFLLLIRRLIAAGLTRQAIRAFEDMESFIETKPSNEDFIYLLDTLCKYGHAKVATEIFNKKKNEFSFDVKLYTVLIYGWCKVGRINMAERFLSEMLSLGIEPNVVTYNVLLNGICRRANLHPDARFETTIKNAEKVFYEMHKRGIEPDVTSFSIVLHVYSRAQKPQLALDKLKQMKKRGLCPTIATYTSVVKCLSQSGRLEEAEELLDDMIESGVSPSALTYNCFFKVYRGTKDGDKALSLYRKMKDGGLCSLSLHSYNILLGMFLELNKMKIVQELWEDMKNSGQGPDLNSYTAVVHGLCEKQKWRQACQFFVEMIEKGVLPRKVTFETLYKGLIQSDMLRTWRRLKKKLDEESTAFGAEFQNYHLKPYRR